MFPPELLKTASVYHLPSSGAKTYPASASATITGAFIPMAAQQHVLEGGVYVNPHIFRVDVNADIRETDKVVIDGVTYYVKLVKSFPGERDQIVSREDVVWHVNEAFESIREWLPDKLKERTNDPTSQ